MSTSYTEAEIGVIGGSGLYAFVDHARDVAITTHYGYPSDRLLVGEIGDRSIAFLPRHGRRHRFPRHKINYRANLWALRPVGVRQVLAPCARRTSRHLVRSKLGNNSSGVAVCEGDFEVESSCCRHQRTANRDHLREEAKLGRSQTTMEALTPDRFYVQ